MLLDFSKTEPRRARADAPDRARRGARRAGPARRHARAARRSTRPRTARCCTPRCATAPARPVLVDGQDVMPEVDGVLARMAAFARGRARRRDRRDRRRAVHRRGQHRHRRQRPRAGDGDAGARALPRRPARALRLERRRRARARRAEGPRPRRGHDAWPDRRAPASADRGYARDDRNRRPAAPTHAFRQRRARRIRPATATPASPVRPRRQSSPCNPSRLRHVHHRRRGCRRQPRRTPTADCPRSQSAPAAHEGAPDPWSATPDRMASSRARSWADGKRERWSKKIVSVNVRSVINEVTS